MQKSAEYQVVTFDVNRVMFVEEKSALVMFNRRKLTQLIVPLIIEQFLAIAMGAVDTVMVSQVGQAAVSGVSLVDSINILLINIFAALATGGAVVASQYLGRRNVEKAQNAAKQLLFAILTVSTLVAVLCLIFRVPLLRLAFNQVDADVMANAQTYFWLSALSYPFIAIYNGGAALFRAMGNSRIAMVTSLIMNGFNVVGNAILMFGFGLGVFGAAFATLLSRILGAVVVVLLLRGATTQLSIYGISKMRPDGGMIKNILKVGLPNGFENGLFQIGKILVASLVSTFGTAAVAANAVGSSLSSLGCVPSSAIGLAMITVVGQCVGAGEYQQTKKYTGLLMKLSYLAMLVTDGTMMLLSSHLVRLFNVPPETAQIARQIFLIHSSMGILFWPASFTLPNALRAAGDAKYTMTVSMLSMWLCRLGLSYLLGSFFHWGVQGVWIAMTIDWVFRSIFFIVRFVRGKWQSKNVIDPA